MSACDGWFGRSAIGVCGVFRGVAGAADGRPWLFFRTRGLLRAREFEKGIVAVGSYQLSLM
jgi:hypothetical protein